MAERQDSSLTFGGRHGQFMSEVKDLSEDVPFAYYVEGKRLVCDLRSLVPKQRTRVIQELRTIFDYSHSKSPLWTVHCFVNDENSISTPMDTRVVRMQYTPSEGEQGEQTLNDSKKREYFVRQALNDNEYEVTQSCAE